MKEAYDVHSEMVVQPYQRGVRLVRPRGRMDEALLSVEKLQRLSTQASFTNLDHEYIAMNNQTMEVIGADSLKSCLGKTPASFSSKKFGAQVLRNYHSVLQTQTLQIIEECGERVDDLPIQALNFRLPWYYDKKIIGVLNFSMLVESNALPQLTTSIAEVVATGLIGAMPVTRIQRENNCFTKRENQVLHYLLKGYTAKNIAEALFLSKRTVEHHIENMKMKSSCESKFELINKFSFVEDID